MTDVIGWTLVHFLWEGTLIALAVALVLRVLRRASAHARYTVACMALFTALLAPPLTAAILAMAPLTGSSRTFAPDVSSTLPVVGDGIVAAGRVTAAIVAGNAQTPGANLSSRLLTAFVAFWIAGVVVLTVRLAFGWWRVRRIHLEALAAPASPWTETAARIASRLGLSRVIHVVDSDRIDTPTVIGWLRPVVLLPIAALANLTPDQVQAILVHELAHIRRHDFIVNLLQTIAETVLFYHPAVWWLSARIRIEREHCCDDVAVEVCGDPLGYAEALTALASWARERAEVAAATAAPLALAATGGSLLYRVRRLLRLPVESERRQPKAPFVIGATVVIVLVVGVRLMVVAQIPASPDDSRSGLRIKPYQVNRILGFDLFPGPPHYATDDPVGARAWDAKVAYPGGEMSFMGFTARGLIRYAYALDRMPVVDGPSWLDTRSLAIRAETSSEKPEDPDLRQAIRVALEGQYGISIRREARLFPVYGLQMTNSGALGPNIRPAATDCIEDARTRPDIMGPSLHARGEVVVPFCGIDNTIRGPRGFRVTLAQFARSLRGFGMGQLDHLSVDREVVDQSGLTGVYDFELNLGFLPLALIATAHPNLGIGFGPMIRTFPQAIEEQLGLKLVPSEAPYEVAVIAAARQALVRQPVEEGQLAAARGR